MSLAIFTIHGFHCYQSDKTDLFMPIYEYQSTDKPSCTFCVDGFDVLQKLTDAPLDVCPKCQQAVRRQISVPNIGRSGSATLERSNLEKHGFTRYEKAEKGVYEKTAGVGPKLLKDK